MDPGWQSLDIGSALTPDGRVLGGAASRCRLSDVV